MSNMTISIWDPANDAKPMRSFEEGVARFNQCREESREPTPNLLAFGERLQAFVEAHRDWFEDEEDFLNDFGLRLAADVAANRETVYSLEMPYGGDAALRLKRAAVDAAFDLGLMIFDEDIGLIVAPGRKMYPPSKAKLWKGMGEYLDILASEYFPSTGAGFAKLINPMLEQMMLRHGFVKMEKQDDTQYASWYQRKIELGEQKVTFVPYSRRGGGFAVGVSFDLRYDAILNICEAAGFPQGTGWISDDISLANGTLPQHSKSGVYSPRYEIYDVSDLGSYFKVLEENLFNIINMASHVSGLDKLLNVGNEYSGIRCFAQNKYMMPACLVVARLANNAQFEELSISLSTGVPWLESNMSVYKDSWEKLVNYLRNEVKPLIS
ncbi:hypothetical protein EV700_2172 [Fluviicoccus keumensis]|uniref:Uncharacterized protein n=1 Tax=Fluviicoccus keumensis TaxID=1435465 RepID=A0A4Q7Z4N3_9GAMM|nr:hypothetical protein [Fluviicoccus keumensis]RZU45352.1 hypothetical protein EV700_2172 [Fluviicoccus keumensis]